MPIYEYQCQACGHRLDQLQKVADPTLTDCPKCGKASLQRLISAAGFQLKGTGWYVTDFKNSDKPKATKTSTETATPTTTEKTAEATSKISPVPEKSSKKAEEK